MVISDTFCWRIPKEHGCYVIGCFDLVVAIAINIAIIHCYMYGNMDELSTLCQNHGTHNYDGENLNCPPAEVNRTIMYLLAFATFACNFLIFMYPFSLFRAYKMKTPEILVMQIVGGIIKLMCIFVYAVLAALFLPVRGFILLFVIVFEHYKIRHTLYMYIHLKNQQNLNMVDRLRQEAEKQMALLVAHNPPSYDEAIALIPPPTLPVTSTEPHDTDQSTRIAISAPIVPQDIDQSTSVAISAPIVPQDIDQSTSVAISVSTAPDGIDQSTSVAISAPIVPQDIDQSTSVAISAPIVPQDMEHSSTIDKTIPLSLADHQATEQSTRTDVSTTIPVPLTDPQDSRESTSSDVSCPIAPR